MSYRQLPNITQWQTGRKGGLVTVADTLLTDYNPAELDAATKLKILAVHPASAIMIRFFGLGANNGTCDAYFSGWMDLSAKKGPGIGHKYLAAGGLTLGNRTWTTGKPPNDDGQWPAPGAGAAAYFEVDTPTLTVADGAGCIKISAADRSGFVIMPTLGYTHILAEFNNFGNGLTAIGYIWRPVKMGSVVRTNGTEIY